MSELTIQLDDDRTAFRPGEHIGGTVRWALDHDADSLDVRLIWFTRGKGTQDVGVVNQRGVASPARVGNQRFDFKLPEGPYSFSGKLISVVWAVELVTPKGKESTRVEFVVSPTAAEIELGDPAEATP